MAGWETCLPPILQELYKQVCNCAKKKCGCPIKEIHALTIQDYCR